MNTVLSILGLDPRLLGDQDRMLPHLRLLATLFVLVLLVLFGSVLFFIFYFFKFYIALICASFVTFFSFQLFRLAFSGVLTAQLRSLEDEQQQEEAPGMLSIILTYGLKYLFFVIIAVVTGFFISFHLTRFTEPMLYKKITGAYVNGVDVVKGTEPVKEVSFTPDGEKLLVRFEDILTITKIFDPNSQIKLDKKGSLNDVELSHTGKKIVLAADSSGEYNLETGVKKYNLKKYVNRISSVHYSPNDSSILSIQGKYLYVYKIPKSVPNKKVSKKIQSLNYSIKIFGNQDSIVNAGYSLDGQYMILTGSEKVLILNNEGKLLKEFVAEENEIVSAEISADSKFLLISDKEKIRHINLLNGSTLKTFLTKNKIAKYCGSKIVVCGQRVISVFSTNSTKVENEIFFSANVSGFEISPDSLDIAVITKKGIKIVHLEDSNIIRSYDLEEIGSIAYSPPCEDDPSGGNMLAVGTKIGNIKLYELRWGMSQAVMFFISHLSIIHWIVGVLGILLILSPILILDLFLDKQYLQHRYRMLHITRIVTENASNNARIEELRAQWIERELSKYESGLLNTTLQSEEHINRQIFDFVNNLR